MPRLLMAIVGCGAAIAAMTTHALAAPDACGPSVRVSGDPDVAKEIRRSLAERGLGEVATAACPPMRVQVERLGERLRVEVTDGYGRRSQRDVRDTATAIVLIESWARPEVVGDDLPGAAAPRVDPAPSVTSRVVPRATPSATGLALIGGADYARDGTTWTRGGAAGCIAAGPVCVGARLEVARAIDPGDHPRRATSLAATVELPRRLGPIAVVPGVGVGGVWATLDGFGAHQDQTQDVTSLRVLATVALRLGLAPRWAIELEVGGEAEAIGDAVPGSLGRAGLGLRYGGR